MSNIITLVLIASIIFLSQIVMASDAPIDAPSNSPPSIQCPAGFYEIVKDTGDELDIYTWDAGAVHHIDIYFNVPPELAGSPGLLVMRYYDVDVAYGEIDEVFLNNVYLGYMTIHSDETFAEEVFPIPIGVVTAGVNHIMVQIDEDTPNPDPAVSPINGNWAMSVDSIRVCLGASYVGGEALRVGGAGYSGWLALTLGLLLLVALTLLRLV